MGYRKLAADHLFTGHQLLDNSRVLVTDTTGRIEEVISIHDAGDGVEHFRGILTPGFINCHCHLELSHLKGRVAPGGGMVPFLLSVMKDRFQPLQEIIWSIEAAEQMMIRSGIVAVGDICNTDHTISAKRRQRLYYQNFIEAAGFNEAAAGARFDDAIQTCQKFLAIENSAASIVPHAPYSVSEGLFRLINDHDRGSILTMHNQESEAENQFFIEGGGDLTLLFETLGIDIGTHRPAGFSSLLNCIHLFSNDHSLILVHNVMTSRHDLQVIAERRTPALYWCVCVNANRYIGNKFPDLHLLREYNCKIVLGTDSLASNEQLSITEELKTIHQHFPGIPLAEILGWATRNGAEALRIENNYGSFDSGKTPGVVLLTGVEEGLFTPAASSERIL